MWFHLSQRLARESIEAPNHKKTATRLKSQKEVNPLGPDFDDLPFSIPEIPTLKTDRSLNDRIILPRRMFSTEPLRRIRPFIRATVSEPEKFQGNLGLARLGMKLFYDPRFSDNKQISCSSCHQPEFDFTDNRKVAKGVALGTMNSMSNLNVFMKRNFFWDGRSPSLVDQAKGPVENALEHGSSRTMVVYTIYHNYKEEYEKLFGEFSDEISSAIEERTLAHAVDPNIETGTNNRLINRKTARWKRNYTELNPRIKSELDKVFNNFAKAISAYEMGLQATDSPYDRFARRYLSTGLLEASFNEGFGYKEAFGLERFFSAGCTTCHNGKAFQITECTFLALRPTRQSPESIRSFTAPLRNLSKTSPYMHDGRFANLFQVIDHYNRNSSILPTRPLNPNEKAAVVSFLISLNAQARDTTAEKLRSLQRSNFIKPKE